MKSTHQINRFILIVFISSLVHIVLVNSQDHNRQSTGGSSKDVSSNGWNSAEKTGEDSGSSENRGDDDHDDDDKDEEEDDEDEDDEEDDDDDDHYRVPPGHGNVHPIEAATPGAVDVDVDTTKHFEDSHEIFLPSVADGHRPVDVEVAGQNTVSGQESETPQQSQVADGNFSANHDEKTLFVAVGVAFSVVIVLAAVLLFVITMWRRRRQKSRSGANLTTSRHESIEFETIPNCGTLDESAPVAPARVTFTTDAPPGYDEATRRTQ